VLQGYTLPTRAPSYSRRMTRCCDTPSSRSCGITIPISLPRCRHERMTTVIVMHRAASYPVTPGVYQLDLQIYKQQTGSVVEPAG
jgi:hypothetical protein